MARKALVEKTKRKKKLTKQYAEKREKLVNIIKDPNESFDNKRVAQEKLAKLPRNSSATRIRNICAITGRSRGYMGDFMISRIKFRELALMGLLPGVKKTSW